MFDLFVTNSQFSPQPQRRKKRTKEKKGQVISVHSGAYYQMRMHLFVADFLRNAVVTRAQADSCLLNTVSTKGDHLSIFNL